MYVVLEYMCACVHQCLQTLHYLSSVPEYNTALLSEGVVERIDELCTHESEDRLKLACAQVLTNLTCSVSVHETLRVRV